MRWLGQTLLQQHQHQHQQNQVRALVSQANQLGSSLEDLSDENAALRAKAGVPPGDAVDAAGVRAARDVALAQLRGVNALLERQVADLEEERRKLRLELKFRAKYHGRWVWGVDWVGWFDGWVGWSQVAG